MCNNSPAEETSPENGWRCSVEPIPRREDNQSNAMSLTSRRVAAMALKVSDVSPPGAVAGADHGGSSKYSSENLEDQRG